MREMSKPEVILFSLIISILLWVSPATVTSTETDLVLLSPEDGSLLGYSPCGFSWEKSGKASFYLIQYFNDPNSNPVFSTYTGKTCYSLPEPVIRNI